MGWGEGKVHSLGIHHIDKATKKENPPFPKSTPFIHLPHSKNKCIQMI